MKRRGQGSFQQWAAFYWSKRGFYNAFLKLPSLKNGIQPQAQQKKPICYGVFGTRANPSEAFESTLRITKSLSPQLQKLQVKWSTILKLFFFVQIKFFNHHDCFITLHVCNNIYSHHRNDPVPEHPLDHSLTYTETPTPKSLSYCTMSAFYCASNKLKFPFDNAIVNWINLL